MERVEIGKKRKDRNPTLSHHPGGFDPLPSILVARLSFHLPDNQGED
jgi:hypothetical protein